MAKAKRQDAEEDEDFMKETYWQGPPSGKSQPDECTEPGGETESAPEGRR